MERLKRNEVSEEEWGKYIVAENKAYDKLVEAGFSPQGINKDFTKVIVFKIENQNTNDEHKEVYSFNTWQEAVSELYR